MKFKYAASASFYTCPDVVDILHSCDCIFTSNVDARDELYAALGSHRVHFIPGFLLANPNVRKEIQSGQARRSNGSTTQTSGLPSRTGLRTRPLMTS